MVRLAGLELRRWWLGKLPAAVVKKGGGFPNPNPKSESLIRRRDTDDDTTSTIRNRGNRRIVVWNLRFTRCCDIKSEQRISSQENPPGLGSRAIVCLPCRRRKVCVAELLLRMSCGNSTPKIAMKWNPRKRNPHHHHHLICVVYYSLLPIASA